MTAKSTAWFRARGEARVSGFQRCALGVGPWLLLGLACSCGGPSVESKAPELRSGRPTKASLAVRDPVENAPERFIAEEPARAPAAAQHATNAPGAEHEQTAGKADDLGPREALRAAPLTTATGHGLVESLVRGKGDEADRELALGDAALGRKAPETALVHYRKARRLIPAEAAPVVGIVLARLGVLNIPTEYAGGKNDPRLRELFQLLDQAERLEPAYGQTFLQRGRLQLIHGDAAKAMRALSRATELLPLNAESHSALAVAALAQGKIDAAVAGFSRAAELDPNDAARQTNLGTALMMSGDAQGAISAYRRAVSLDPKDARARGDLGTALLATNNVPGAIPHLVEAQQLAPERATFMNNLGYALQQQGDLGGALQWLEKALEKDPTLGSAWINLGIVRLGLGDRAAAEQAFQKALSLDPTDPRAKANLEELRALPSPR